MARPRMQVPSLQTPRASELDDLLGGACLRELERLGGVSGVTLARWRQGKCKPRHDAIQRLAVALGLSFATVAEAVSATVAMAKQLPHDRGATMARGTGAAEGTSAMSTASTSNVMP